MKTPAESNDTKPSNLEHSLDKDARIEDYIDRTESLRMYLEEKGKWHVHYRHYSLEETLKAIFDNNSLVLSDGSSWNDKEDQKRFNSDLTNGDSVNFGVCFSFSYSESVAMWFMYAGKAKTGGCLQLSRYDIHKICTQSVPRIVDNKEKTKVEKILSKGEYSIKTSDVVYQGKKNSDNRIRLSHLGDNSAVADASVIEGLKEVVKNESWSYENECRLIVTVRKEAIPREYLGNCSIMLPLPVDTIKKLAQKMVKAPYYCSDGFLKDKRESSLTGEIDSEWLDKQ